MCAALHAAAEVTGRSGACVTRNVSIGRLTRIHCHVEHTLTELILAAVTRKWHFQPGYAIHR